MILTKLKLLVELGQTGFTSIFCLSIGGQKRGELSEIAQFLQANQVKVGLRLPLILRGVESNKVLIAVEQLKDYLDAVVVSNWSLSATGV